MGIRGTREAKDPMKRSWAWILLLAASTAPASSGCAYLEARARDFQDCFRFYVQNRTENPLAPPNPPSNTIGNISPWSGAGATNFN